MQQRVYGQPGNCLVADITRADATTIAAFDALPVAAIGDVMGRRAIMDAGIQPLDRRSRLAGPALTVETRPGDNLMIHAALKVSRPGDILVINGHGYDEAAVWGMLMTHSAIALQLGGLVIDGAIRDCVEIMDSGFPAFTRHICAAGPHKDGPGQVNLPVSCGGVVVQPGDVVIGDGDGIVVVPRDLAAGIAADARKKVAAEAKREREINEEGKHHQSWLIPNLREKGILGPEEEL